jgi:hypothetical protein
MTVSRRSGLEIFIVERKIRNEKGKWHMHLPPLDPRMTSEINRLVIDT